MPIKSRDWHAWINLMPPKPDDFHVVGMVLVGNPGIQAHLCVKEPQGINPEILLMDLHLVQLPGIWPQVLTWAPARYDQILAPGATQYTEVDIFHENASIARIKVEVVR